jgi:DNA-binding MarR family transcriptional regulator
MRVDIEASPVLADHDVVSSVGVSAEELFQHKKEESVEPLQNLLDVLTAKVVGIVFEAFRDSFDGLLRLLRNAYGQIARFVDGDFRQHPSFYLGQLHALGEVAHRLAHQRVPKEAVEVVARSQVMQNVLTKVLDRRSIGATELAEELSMAESNLSASCKELVENDLLRRHRFGKRVRYAPTPLTYAVVAQLKLKEKPNGSPDVVARAAAAGSGASLAPDWPILSVEAAAASFKPGSNVMANTSDFVSGLLTVAELQGAQEVAIDPGRSRVHLETTTAGAESQSHLDLPKSLSDSLTDQVNSVSEQLRTRWARLKHGSSKRIVHWQGQTLAISSEQTEEGPRLRVKFVGKSDPALTKSKARVAFKEIQKEKTRIHAFQKLYVAQILKGCDGNTSRAADVLGMRTSQFDSLKKQLNL